VVHPVREFVFSIDVLQNGPVRGTGSLLARGGGRFRLRPRRRDIGDAGSGRLASLRGDDRRPAARRLPLGVLMSAAGGGDQQAKRKKDPQQFFGSS